MALVDESVNDADFFTLGWDTLCGIPLNSALKKKIRPFIMKKIISINNRVKCNKTIFYVKTIPYRLGKVKGTLAICFNKRKENELREFRYDEIRNAEKLLSKGRSIKLSLKDLFDKKGKIIEKKVIEVEEFDGYCCLFSTRPLLKEEMIRLYFDKDIVEKAFRCLKGITQLRPVRHWLHNRVTAHIMICYLSYVLLIVLKQYLFKLNLPPEKALQQLDTMYKVYMKDSKKKFKISRIVTLTKVQKDILGAIDKKLTRLNPSG